MKEAGHSDGRFRFQAPASYAGDGEPRFAGAPEWEEYMQVTGDAGLEMVMGELATLRDRKLANIAALKPAVIATRNLGCMTQLASGTEIPVVHTVELLDWATGGPKPEALT